MSSAAGRMVFLTEDAELSLRLLQAGWRTAYYLHVDQAWGHGIMPLTFEALKGQRYRWCFGGIQLPHALDLDDAGPRGSGESPATLGQRWAYLAGGASGTGTCSACCSLSSCSCGAVNSTPGGPAVPQAHRVPGRRRPGDGAARAGPRGRLLRRGTGASWRLGVLHLAVHLVVARARRCWSLFAKERLPAAPKTSERTKWWEAAAGQPGVGRVHARAVRIRLPSRAR